MEVDAGSGFQSLPEGCIADIIAFTSPRDSCRLAAVSVSFRSAADSDTVWDRFLPSDLRSILDRAVDPVEYSSKKELFFRLPDPILIDGGRISFSLDKSSGAKCYMLSVRELYIVWGDTPAYWRWISAEPSSSSTRFSEVAHLANVCWLEIRGKIDSRVLSTKTKYAAYLVFKLVEETRGLRNPAQEVSVKVGVHESTHEVRLQSDEVDMPLRGSLRFFHRFFSGMAGFPPGQGTERSVQNNDARVPSSRADGWMEIEMGEFYSDDGDDGDVEMCLMEVKGGHWKSGLMIQGIDVRPKSN